ncbi:MAG: PLD nuclease N-terminal domain-containing protein [Coriobacteriales bacterium]|nr:PLD nuclease N-terminal domain-containing protein [Coriobacteriales bacterium]
MVAALIHIFRHKNYRTGNRLLWVILVVCINFVGPIIYFVLADGSCRHCLSGPSLLCSVGICEEAALG